MKVLFLCGIIEEEIIEEIVEKAISSVDFAANLFQQKISEGFYRISEKSQKSGVSGFGEFPQCKDISVLSAPFIGSYPRGSKMRSFKGFDTQKSNYTYVKFNNIWGIRNISRTRALKKAIKDFAKKEGEKLILIYCPHTPFIKAAEYAKKIDKNIKICLYAPDVPQYMNISTRISPIYKIAKKIDIASMMRHMGCIDSFMLLTKHMTECLPVGNKPFRVIEGIVSPRFFEDEEGKRSNVSECETKGCVAKGTPSQFADDTNCNHEGKPALSIDDIKYIVYTGSIMKRYGIINLVDAMKHITDSRMRLVICGRGDAYQHVKEASEKDKRIILSENVSPKIAKEWRNKATVLVNPRQGNEVYTRYSFPSKNIDYLLTGKPTVAYLLEGMPDVYKNFIFEVPKDIPPSIALARTIEKALCSDNKGKREGFAEYAKNNLLADNIANEIIKLSFGK